jgi:hypothetical protein
MPMATEENKRRDLMVSREPVGPVKKSGQKTDGEQALSDAMVMIVAAWVILFLLAFSLRGHIV